MNTRKIGYIDDNEDAIQREIDWALTKTPEERLMVYCQVLRFNMALAGIDCDNYPSRYKIYYLDEE